MGSGGYPSGGTRTLGKSPKFPSTRISCHLVCSHIYPPAERRRVEGPCHVMKRPCSEPSNPQIQKLRDREKGKRRVKFIQTTKRKERRRENTDQKRKENEKEKVKKTGNTDFTRRHNGEAETNYRFP